MCDKCNTRLHLKSVTMEGQIIGKLGKLWCRAYAYGVSLKFLFCKDADSLLSKLELITPVFIIHQASWISYVPCNTLTLQIKFFLPVA